MKIWNKEITSNDYAMELRLARGFIMTGSDLCRISAHNQDLDYYNSFKTEEGLKNLFNDVHDAKRFQYGMSGPYDFLKGRINENFNTFRNCKFGVKVPVEFLDPGIALLVKTLPLIGTMTVMSCAGHLKSSPAIYFKDKFHYIWAEHVFTYLFEAENFQFSETFEGWQSHKLIFPAENSIQSHYDSYWTAQKMGRILLDRPNSEKIRMIKLSLNGEEDLFNRTFIHELLKKSDVQKMN